MQKMYMYLRYYVFNLFKQTWLDAITIRISANGDCKLWNRKSFLI